MKLVEIQWNPTNRQLRQFAIICLFALPALGWFFEASAQVIGLLASLGLVLAITGAVFPKAVRPVFLAAMILATPIGMVIGELAIFLIYFMVFLPFGLFFRVIQRDALQLTQDSQAQTYWQAKKQPSGSVSYYRQS